METRKPESLAAHDAAKSRSGLIRAHQGACDFGDLRAVAHQGGAWLLEQNVRRWTWLDRSAKREAAQVKILHACKNGLAGFGKPWHDTITSLHKFDTLMCHGRGTGMELPRRVNIPCPSRNIP